MAKEPEQRYSSAADFAADIERFLARKPILARKQSWRYHLGKFVRRNRLATAVGCIAVLVVLVLTATIWRQAGHLAGERDVARAEQLRADHVVSLLVDLFSTANPEHRPGGGDIMLGEFLNNAENAILQQRGLDPGVQARLRHTIGKVFLARSQYRQARTHLEAALFELRKVKGESDPAVAEAFHDLAKLALESRTAAEAVPLLRQSLQLHRRIYGESHPLVARCMQDLGTALADRQRGGRCSRAPSRSGASGFHLRTSM